MKFFGENLFNHVSVRCVKIVRIWSFSGPYFPVFGLNTEIYSVNLRIQSECGKEKLQKRTLYATCYLDET